jgi:hypothetical protein
MTRLCQFFEIVLPTYCHILSFPGLWLCTINQKSLRGVPLISCILQAGACKSIRDTNFNITATIMFLTEACVATLLAITLVYVSIQSWIRLQRIPASIEWAGLRNEAFGTVRACFREFTSDLETIASGYKMVRCPVIALPDLKPKIY